MKHWNWFGKGKNIVRKGENAGYQHFLLFPQCFQKSSVSGSLKVGIMRWRVRSPSPWFQANHFITMNMENLFLADNPAESSGRMVLLPAENFDVAQTLDSVQSARTVSASSFRFFPPPPTLLDSWLGYSTPTHPRRPGSFAGLLSCGEGGCFLLSMQRYAMRRAVAWFDTFRYIKSSAQSKAHFLGSALS